MLLVLSSTRTAHADPCKNLPNPTVIAGSSAIGPFVQNLGKALAGATPTITLIYQNQGSCTGVNAIVKDITPTGDCASGACITGTGTYYGTDGVAQTCDFETAGTHVDVGASDVFAEACPDTVKPANVGDFLGPAQAMTYVVPKASTQNALVAEEGYFVFGFGAAGMVTPWTNEMLYFVRNQLSGTQQMTSRAVGVPAAKFKGIDSKGSGGVLTAVTGSTDPEGTIGILSTDFADLHRDALTILAFQAFQQKYAYFPDSTPTSFDKKNVRDGHYNIWGYLHLIARVDGSGTPDNANAKTFVDLITGKTAGSGFDVTDITIASHIIPQCAMKVQRMTEIGDLSPFTPAEPCGCYFESKATGAASASCKTCGSDGACGSGKCRRGFCEAK